MTPDEIVAAHAIELARLGASSPEPPPSRRLVDLFLAPIGKDSRSFARRERERLLDAAAREALVVRLCAQGCARAAARARIDAALRRPAVAEAQGAGGSGRP
ncbi:MAG: hypothetical protein GC202_10730 [Alphaproteobacteria bacterium]|nr:hypothetical protein [Alphaproteobacteria bacterium]